MPKVFLPTNFPLLLSLIAPDTISLALAEPSLTSTIKGFCVKALPFPFVTSFKPSLDKRYDKEFVISHDEKHLSSTIVSEPSEILSLAKGYNVVGIDETQFFDYQIVKVCNDLANKGFRVIIAGLDMDYQGNPFGPMPALMATAEYVTKVHAVCIRSGNLANHSFRTSESQSS